MLSLESTGSRKNGETVAIKSAEGAFLAYAAYSPQSQIVARVWSFSETEVVDRDFFARRLKAADRSAPFNSAMAPAAQSVSSTRNRMACPASLSIATAIPWSSSSSLPVRTNGATG